MFHLENNKTHHSGFMKDSPSVQQPHMLHLIHPVVWKLGSQSMGTWKQRGLLGLVSAGVSAFASADPATPHAISIHYLRVFL